MKDKDGNYRVSATASLTSTLIDDNTGVRQATCEHTSITVKTDFLFRDTQVTIEMWDTNNEGGADVLNYWKFEDLDEAEALANLILDRVEESRKDKEVGLIEE
jgi:hypothetical protein